MIDIYSTKIDKLYYAQNIIEKQFFMSLNINKQQILIQYETIVREFQSDYPVPYIDVESVA